MARLPFWEKYHIGVIVAKSLGVNGLKLHYDADGDILYFHFKEGPAESVKEVEDNVLVELDDAGEVMGIEVWGARKKGVLKQLTRAASR